VTAVYRRWPRPRVKPGSTHRTSIGVVSVEKVEPTRITAITESDARRAGAPRCSKNSPDTGRDGSIASPFGVGPDPRNALRARSRLTAAEVDELREKLARLGAATAGGPWALSILHLIEAQPSVRAPDLARQVGMETVSFKARVRQLKELGLTESLDVGYRLSPRGRVCAVFADRRRNSPRPVGFRRPLGGPRLHRRSSRRRSPVHRTPGTAPCRTPGREARPSRRRNHDRGRGRSPPSSLRLRSGSARRDVLQSRRPSAAAPLGAWRATPDARSCHGR